MRELATRRAAEARGHAAERRCTLALRLAGWRILARRYATPVGEIDIVAKRGRLIAIVEVKNRRTLREGLEAVTPYQRNRIERAASVFLSRHPKWRKLALRFDVMVVIPRRWPRHVADAWRPDGAGSLP